MDPMELIDRYIAEVGKDLPRKNRLDIEAEILTALEDMLRDRSQKTGKPVDEEMVVDVLKGYGAPRKVAASYHPEHYVIEPHILQSFLTVIKVVLPIVAAIALVRLGVSLGQIKLTFENIFEAVFLGMADFLGTAFAALGSILVLFVIIHRFLPEFKVKEEDWNPRNLPQATTRNRVEIGATILEIFGAVLAVVVFNFFPEWIGISFQEGIWWLGFVFSGGYNFSSVGILSGAFYDFLPALTALWTLTTALDIALLSRGRWENWSRWSSLGLKVATIALAAAMLAGPILVAVDAGSLITSGFPDALAARLLANFFEQGILVALAITIIASLVHAFRLLVRLTGRNLPPALEKFAHP